jgi:hypothetical protein
MNILRKPPYPLTVEYEGFVAGADYAVELYDDYAFVIDSTFVTADLNGKITYELPLDMTKYDQEVALYIYESDGVTVGDEVVNDYLYVYRPYVDPSTLAETPDAIEEYSKSERIARMIIDSIVDEPFYYKSSVIQSTGYGADFFPMPVRVCRVNYVYRNNVLVYNRFTPVEGQETYHVTPDHTAITIATGEQKNRRESRQITLPQGSSDIVPFTYWNDAKVFTDYPAVSNFPSGQDFIFFVESGYPVVPQDIKEATNLLIDDVKCNRLNYVNRYITEYQTDQFKLKYGERASKGTGNVLVDKILSKYVMQFNRIGVL